MAPRKFDRYMVHIAMGTHPKLGGLTDSEYRAYVSGVLSVAARSPLPGYLLLAPNAEAGPRHISVVAGVSLRSAKSALRKARSEELLRYDPGRDVWYVVGWRQQHDPRVRRLPLSPATRRRVIQRDGLVCGLCSAEVLEEEVEIDHILPVAHGGTNDLTNLQVTHRACNRQKGARR